MEIVPRQIFKDARSVPAKFSRYDPRSVEFNEREVIVNLKDCLRVDPPAVLWCAVYLLLAKRRGSECALVAPDDEGAVIELQKSGLLGVLLDGDVTVRVGKTGISVSPEAILPLSRFDSTSAENLTDQLHISLSTHRQGSANVFLDIVETFSELANNAAEHSESEIGALGFVQFLSKGKERRFLLAVADGGVGIRQTLERNPKHLENYGFEWAAIRKATGELVSGTLSRHRGIGLFSTFDESHRPGRELIIHSGRGIIDLTSNSQARMVRANLFPGTLVFVAMPS